jgi:hypothetical protein
VNRSWLRAVAVAVAAVCVGAAVFLAAALGGLPAIVLALAALAAVVMAAMFLPLFPTGPLASASHLMMAASSRSQVMMRTISSTARLSWEALSASVRWRPSLVTAIVTYLVTRPLRMLEVSGWVDLTIFRRLCKSRRVRRKLA